LPIRDQSGTGNTGNTHLWRHKVAGTLLDGYLAPERVRHLLAVPLQTLQVVLVPVEEVHLAAGLLDPRMQVEHLQQRPGSALSHADDEGLGPEIEPENMNMLVSAISRGLPNYHTTILYCPYSYAYTLGKIRTSYHKVFKILG